MRWNLLKTYDKIYTLDLHGNSKKKETAPDGSADVNVFDIMQGVSINIFIKTGKKKVDELGQVFHFDLFGKRDAKYDFLIKNNLKSIKFEEIENLFPNYYFVQKDFSTQKIFDSAFSVKELFLINNVGVVTANDSILINDNIQNLAKNINSFYSIELNKSLIRKVNYRPFDIRYIYYDTKIIERAREKLMQNFIKGENLALMTCRQTAINRWEHAYITNLIADDSCVSNRSRERGYIFPLYLYSENSTQQTIVAEAKRTPNLKPEIVTEIAQKLNLRFTPEKETEGEVCFANSPDVRPAFRQTFAPIDILDYIYAVLHSPAYREKYKEFLKIDFPRVPYPQDAETFWNFVNLGGQLRQLHLLESEETENYITKYPQDGNNVVEKIRFQTYIYEPVAFGEPYPDYLGAVYINETQYFADVPTSAWEFYIGGYQPAQKWLKDRKGRELTFDDILHYQKIIVALPRTAGLMQEIDAVLNLEPIKETPTEN